MDFEALKNSLKEIEVVKHKEKKSQLVEDCSGYYTIPCSKEPFDGEVIQLSGDEVYVFFQKYGHAYRDEYFFREKLTNMDNWLADKPHRVQRNWLNYIPKWLSKEN